MFDMPILTGDDKQDLRLLYNILEEWSRTLKQFIGLQGIDGNNVYDIGTSKGVNVPGSSLLNITLDSNGLIITKKNGTGMFKVAPAYGYLGLFFTDSSGNERIYTDSSGILGIDGRIVT